MKTFHFTSWGDDCITAHDLEDKEVLRTILDFIKVNHLTKGKYTLNYASTATHFEIE